MSRAWRRLAVRVHAWTGLLAAPLIVVLGLSGAALVFRPELDELLRGSAPLPAPVSPASLDAVLRAALLPHPGAQARALRIAADGRRPYRVEVVHADARLDVDVDPATLRVVASRSPERSVFAAVHALHAALHAGRAGAVIVGLLGLWLVIEGVSGLWLYGPSVTPRAGVRRRGSSRALHRLLGAMSLAGGVLLGVTGAVLALGGALAGGSAPVASPPGGLERLDAIAASVAGASPGARIVAMVAERDGGVRVDVRAGPGGDARSIRVHRTSGVISAVALAPPTPWDVLRRLHAGDFAGWPSRAFYAAVGVALAVLAMTGFVIAARRHSSKVLT